MPANPPGIRRPAFRRARLQAGAAAPAAGARFVGDGTALPDIRRVAEGRDAQGTGWIGLRQREDHTVTGIAALPLLPPWLALALLLGVAVVAWRREA
jgi:hypothetical protein